MRTNTIPLWMFSQFPESVNVLVFAVIKEVLLVCTLQVLLEVRYLDNWLFEEFVRLSFLHLPPPHLLSSSQLLRSWLWPFLPDCNRNNAGLWLLLSLFLCRLLFIIKYLLLILFMYFSLMRRKFYFFRLNVHHVHHTEEYYKCS